MALLQVNFNSATLHRKVPMQVILPSDAENGCTEPFKTLYLLHGLFDNCLGWTANTRIERWAMERNLAVVMPSAENSFYVDMPYGSSCYGDFGAYVGQELVEMTRKMFRLSPKREDTFIAGLSMGGFGALRNGLKYSDTFGYIACLSGAIHIFEYPFDEPGRNVIDEDACFGDIHAAALTDRNPRVAAEAMFAKKKDSGDTPFPKVYIACGTEDYLLRANRTFADFLKANGVAVTYEEGPGAHDWDFWDTYIQKVLEWLPIEKVSPASITGTDQMTWTKDELDKIGNAEELQIASRRRDDTLRKPVIIWVVRVGDELYVRCVNGRAGAWFHGVQTQHAGRIRAGGVEKDVTFVEENDPGINDKIDAAYLRKYARYPQYVAPMVTPEVKAATIRVVPHE